MRLNDVKQKTQSLDERNAEQGKALNVAQKDISDLQKDNKSHTYSMKEIKSQLEQAQ